MIVSLSEGLMQIVNDHSVECIANFRAVEADIPNRSILHDL